MVPPPPSAPTPKRKRTGHTKFVAKHAKTKDLEAQEKAEVEAVIAESLKEQQEKEAKEKADAEALETALQMSKEEATINVPFEDSNDTIQTILKMPINEDFLKSSAPSATSNVLPQTHDVFEVASDSEEECTSPPPSDDKKCTSPPSSSNKECTSPPPSEDVVEASEEFPEPFRVILPEESDPIYPPCASEPAEAWSVLMMEKAGEFEDSDLMILGESSSSNKSLCVPLPLKDLSLPSFYFSCFEQAAAAEEAPLRPFVLLPRTIPKDFTPQQRPSTFHP